MKKKHKDFSSSVETTLVITYEDREWEVPNDMPAYAGIELMMDDGEKKSGLVQLQKFVNIFRATVGEEKYNDIVHTVGLATFTEIAGWLMSEILGIDPDDKSKEEGEEGKPGTEETDSPSPPTQSLPTGHSSKPTLVDIGGQDQLTTDEAVG